MNCNGLSTAISKTMMVARHSFFHDVRAVLRNARLIGRDAGYDALRHCGYLFGNGFFFLSKTFGFGVCFGSNLSLVRAYRVEIFLCSRRRRRGCCPSRGYVIFCTFGWSDVCNGRRRPVTVGIFTHTRSPCYRCCPCVPSYFIRLNPRRAAIVTRLPLWFARRRNCAFRPPGVSVPLF